ncbi:hypothetical protein IHV25_10035 [Phaeovibrio sulfidiphilus]|uniref:Uncharacterized protein n=1 Tax=Phaeovibrio sulfidiphilus TaxID=1220600 RepID=A0A8J6YWY4_9PROT|nr:hypothetical protein [Phaeovibrio sulfidiphilus]MBE1237979.1 hypothetical protein [Phaeovibrio sulfidiphilus]
MNLDTLNPSELKVVEDLFLQGITGKPVQVPRRLAESLLHKGIIEEAVFVTGYTASGAVTKTAFRLSAMGQFRYCMWFEHKTQTA